jgi:hypothetical protein
MMWTDIHVPKVSRIERIAEVFEVTSVGNIPFVKFKIKVLERPEKSNKYIAFPNVAIKDVNGSPDWICGSGNTIEEALDDGINNFMALIPENQELSEEDFEWSAPEDF